MKTFFYYYSWWWICPWFMHHVPQITMVETHQCLECQHRIITLFMTRHLTVCCILNNFFKRSHTLFLHRHLRRHHRRRRLLDLGNRRIAVLLAHPQILHCALPGLTTSIDGIPH